MYNLEIKEVFKRLNSNENGLTETEAKKRLQKYGYNEIKAIKKFKILKLILSQFQDPLIYILLIAILISILIKAKTDAIVITAILILNAALGFSQEYKAERAISLLKQISAPMCKIIRHGKEMITSSRKLVPGDIIFLDVGDKVPADARLIHQSSLEVDESILTGESTPVIKEATVIKHEAPVTEQRNMIFSGTIVTNGKAKAIVTSTGMQAELGKIASLVETVKEEKTPLQKNLENLGKWLLIFTTIAVILVFAIGIYAKFNFIEMFLTSLSLAVSVIPEGLPAVITITLAISVKRLLKKNALIRKLRAIETLGSITVICSDKTGTITKNEMKLTKLYVDNKKINLNQRSKNKDLLLTIGINCNNAILPNIGDPTDLALLKARKEFKKEERIGEIPFTSETKYMVTFHKKEDKTITYFKGAVEVTLPFCSYIKIGDKIKHLTKEDKKKIIKVNENFANSGLRVLAFAYKEDDKLKDLTFVGLAGMIDTPRKEIKPAIKLCKEAGIRSIMITGDHKLTAESIARQVGITGKTLTGEELDQLTDEKLAIAIKDTNIFARVVPAHKVRILDALQKQGEIVAMTGDGVNDAPALKKADVGVAMSIKGTDIARESSDVVLIDDNFASIVNAIKEGRTIYDNIKKFLKFLLASNFDELIVILTSIILKIPLPLLPLQILWINLITDGLPALALGVDPAEKGVMNRKPRHPKENILHGMKLFIIIAGLIAAIATLTIFILEYNSTGNLDKARTLAVTTTIMFEMFFVFSCRSNHNLLKHNIFANKKLIIAVIISIVLHSFIIYTPFLSNLFKLTTLTLNEWLKVIAFASSGFIIMEIKKFIK